jgi:lysophospholipase L1-like esterase
MAAGPGISPRVTGSPRTAGRSARNYPHLVAADLGLDLVDVTYSGATTAHVLTDAQRGAPPQVDTLDGTEAVVTVTIGGNDVGYVGGLMSQGLPGPLRLLTSLLPGERDLHDPDARERALEEAAGRLRAVGETLRARAPRARVVFVDYLTLLPPDGDAPPLSSAALRLGRHLADRLAALTAEAALGTGCEVVSAAAASAGHHAWSAEPWVSGAGLPLPGRPVPFHPTAAGMRAVADLVVAHLRSGDIGGPGRG